MTKERPILFSAPMVRAILDGTKTQTRRKIKRARGSFWDHAGYRLRPWLDGMFCFFFEQENEPTYHAPTVICPHGIVGERLWVKEAWEVASAWDGYKPSELDPMVKDTIVYPYTQVSSGGYYRHALFMPRWASRITLEITAVRVERLQDISEEDLKSEGLQPSTGLEAAGAFGIAMPSKRFLFMALWESIHGKSSWDKNPWVWVIAFRDAKPEVQP